MKLTAFVLLVILALVVTTVAFGCGSATPSGTAFTASTVTTGSTASVDIAQGKSIFGNNCARCHGIDGKGIIGPNLHNETDLSKVENQVRNGGQAMPSFRGQLSDVQISAVAQYVLSLGGS